MDTCAICFEEHPQLLGQNCACVTKICANCVDGTNHISWCLKCLICRQPIPAVYYKVTHGEGDVSDIIRTARIVRLKAKGAEYAATIAELGGAAEAEEFRESGYQAQADALRQKRRGLLHSHGEEEDAALASQIAAVARDEAGMQVLAVRASRRKEKAKRRRDAVARRWRRPGPCPDMTQAQEALALGAGGLILKTMIMRERALRAGDWNGYNSLGCVREGMIKRKNKARRELRKLQRRMII